MFGGFPSTLGLCALGNEKSILIAGTYLEFAAWPTYNMIDLRIFNIYLSKTQSPHGAFG